MQDGRPRWPSERRSALAGYQSEHRSVVWIQPCCSELLSTPTAPCQLHCHDSEKGNSAAESKVGHAEWFCWWGWWPEYRWWFPLIWADLSVIRVRRGHPQCPSVGSLCSINSAPSPCSEYVLWPVCSLDYFVFWRLKSRCLHNRTPLYWSTCVSYRATL